MQFLHSGGQLTQGGIEGSGRCREVAVMGSRSVKYICDFSGFLSLKKMFIVTESKYIDETETRVTQTNDAR